MKNNFDSLYAKVEAKYKNATGAARIAFREVLDMICDEVDTEDTASVVTNVLSERNGDLWNK